MTDQYSNSGVNTQSRDETLSGIWGGGRDSGAPKSNSSVGMQTNWTEGNLMPTQAPGPGDLGGFTARTATGAPISDLATLSGGDLVTIGGETMSAEVALHLGFLMRDPKSGLIRSPDGNEARPEAAEETQRDERQADQDAPEALDDHSEAILSEVVEGARGEALAAADNIMESGEISPHNVEQLASRLGIEPQEVEARAEHVRAAFHRQAVEVSSRSVGVSPAVAAAALEYARLHNHGALKQAAEQHLNAGTVRYDGFVRDYVQNLDTIAPDHILSSLPGKARRDAGTGSIVVKTRHGEMLWGAAVRAGLIKI